jgi:hypothetical protein
MVNRRLTLLAYRPFKAGAPSSGSLQGAVMNPENPPISARMALLALAAGVTLALGAYALTKSPDLLAQAAWAYSASLLLVATPPPRRRALFALLLTMLIALVANLQDAFGHDVTAADAAAQMAGVWVAYAVIKLGGLLRLASPEQGPDAAGLPPMLGA